MFPGPHLAFRNSNLFSNFRLRYCHFDALQVQPISKGCWLSGNALTGLASG